jgi:hypothetical protein
LTSFDQTIKRVNEALRKAGLKRLVGKVKVRVVRPGRGSFYLDNDEIELDVSVAAWTALAVRSREFLYLHELGHRCCERLVKARDRAALKGVFGDVTGKRRYNLKFRHKTDPSFVSRYAGVHPAEDFAETFALVVYAKLNKVPLKDFLEGKNATCRRKVRAARRLVAKLQDSGVVRRKHCKEA